MNSSCVTERKAKRWAYEHKEVLAKWCKDCFPVKPISVIKGDTIVKLDTITHVDSVLVNVDCPDGTVVPCPPNKVVTRLVKTHSTDTVKIVDTANEYILKHRLDSLKSELDLLKGKYSEMKDSRDGWRKFSLWGLAIIGVVILLKVKRVF